MAIKIDGKLVAGRGAPGLSAYQSAQLGGYTGTEEEFYSVLSYLGAGGIQMDLLWENASPTSEFAAQTITVNGLKTYDMVYVFAYVWTDNVSGVAFTAPYSAKGILLNQAGVGEARIGFRKVGWENDEVTFGDCKDVVKYNDNSGNRIDNTILVPYRIYGIKGVQMAA